MEEKLALEMQVVALANQLNRAKEEIDDLKKRNKLLQESNSKLADMGLRIDDLWRTLRYTIEQNLKETDNKMVDLSAGVPFPP